MGGLRALLAEIVPTSYRVTAKEIFWIFVVAVGLQLLQVGVTTDIDKVADWRAWAVSLLGSLIRTGCAAVIAWRARRPRGG